MGPYGVDDGLKGEEALVDLVKAGPVTNDEGARDRDLRGEIVREIQRSRVSGGDVGKQGGARDLRDRGGRERQRGRWGV